MRTFHVVVEAAGVAGRSPAAVPTRPGARPARRGGRGRRAATLSSSRAARWPMPSNSSRSRRLVASACCRRCACARCATRNASRRAAMADWRASAAADARLGPAANAARPSRRRRRARATPGPAATGCRRASGRVGWGRSVHARMLAEGLARGVDERSRAGAVRRVHLRETGFACSRHQPRAGSDHRQREQTLARVGRALRKGRPARHRRCSAPASSAASRQRPGKRVPACAGDPSVEAGINIRAQHPCAACLQSRCEAVAAADSGDQADAQPAHRCPGRAGRAGPRCPSAGALARPRQASPARAGTVAHREHRLSAAHAHRLQARGAAHRVRAGEHDHVGGERGGEGASGSGLLARGDPLRDSASRRQPARAAASRRPACWPAGRSDSTVQAVGGSGGASVGIPPAWHRAIGSGTLCG